MFEVYRNGYISIIKDFDILRLSYTRNEFNSYMKIYKGISIELALQDFKKEIDCLGY